MSKVSIEGNALGSGTFTIASPNSNSNRTLNLPDSSGTVVVTGGAQTIEFAAGTVSAPSITTTGDTNTGIFFPAADTIAFTEGGTEAMRIDSSGNVLIGTTANSTGAKINIATDGSAQNRVLSFTNTQASGRTYQFVNGGETAGLFQIYDDTASAGRFAIDSSGNVGIGTSAPVRPFVLRTGSGVSSVIKLANADSGETLTDGFDIAFDGANGYLNLRESGFLSFSTNNAERARITSGGDFRIGTTATINGEKLGILTDLNGLLAKTTASANSYEPFLAVRNGNVGKAITFWHSDTQQAGYINIDNTTTVSINNTSDYRIKKDIQPLVNSISRVKNLNPVSFTFTVDDYATEGFIAHEVAEVMPQAVHGIKDEVQIKKVEVSPGVYEEQEVPKYQAMDQSKLIPLLTSALKEAIQKIETLEANNAALEARITAIENGA
jgi:hypothetical protein